MNCSYDTYSLRNNACFSVPLGKNISWVPVNELGKTRFNNLEIRNLLGLEPETKQHLIHNLYEAIQLFEASDFKEELDVIDILDENILWEHHKPGYMSVITNSGCCSSIASWLVFILKDCYEEVGLISFSRENGSGHVYNYILDRGWYYIIDLLPFCKKYREGLCVETGKRSDFANSKYITGVCMKAATLKDYAVYYNRLLKFHGFTHLFFQHRMETCPPIHVEQNQACTYIDYPIDTNTICLTPPSKNLKYRFIKTPEYIPVWDNNGRKS